MVPGAMRSAAGTAAPRPSPPFQRSSGSPRGARRRPGWPNFHGFGFRPNGVFELEMAVGEPRGGFRGRPGSSWAVLGNFNVPSFFDLLEFGSGVKLAIADTTLAREAGGNLN